VAAAAAAAAAVAAVAGKETLTKQMHFDSNIILPLNPNRSLSNYNLNKNVRQFNLIDAKLIVVPEQS
jgi:hypothetical protein